MGGFFSRGKKWVREKRAFLFIAGGVFFLVLALAGPKVAYWLLQKEMAQAYPQDIVRVWRGDGKGIGYGEVEEFHQLPGVVAAYWEINLPGVIFTDGRRVAGVVVRPLPAAAWPPLLAEKKSGPPGAVPVLFPEIVELDVGSTRGEEFLGREFDLKIYTIEKGLITSRGKGYRVRISGVYSAACRKLLLNTVFVPATEGLKMAAAAAGMTPTEYVAKTKLPVVEIKVDRPERVEAVAALLQTKGYATTCYQKALKTYESCLRLGKWTAGAAATLFFVMGGLHLAVTCLQNTKLREERRERVFPLLLRWAFKEALGGGLAGLVAALAVTVGGQGFLLGKFTSGSISASSFVLSAGAIAGTAFVAGTVAYLVGFRS